MTRMVRKQVYIRPEQNALLKRRARELGVPESELVRQGIDEATARPPKGPRDPEAWAAFMAFAKKRGEMRVPQTGRTWTRDELYEDD